VEAEVLDQALDRRRHALIGLARRWLLSAAQQNQVGALGRGQAQRTAHRLENVERCADVAALLEPRVPGSADSGQMGDLLASKTGRTPAAAVREADILGLQARAALAQKVCELCAAPLPISGGELRGRDRCRYLDFDGGCF